MVISHSSHTHHQKDIKLSEDVAKTVCLCVLCVCVTSILGEFQRGDPVTDPHLSGSDRISPARHSHTYVCTHTHILEQTNDGSVEGHTLAHKGGPWSSDILPHIFMYLTHSIVVFPAILLSN